MIDPNLDTLIKVAFAEGMTQSEMTTMDNCGKLWYWTYARLLKRKGSFSWPLIFGHAFHGTMEDMYATAGKRWQPRELVMPDDAILNEEGLYKKQYWQGVLNVQTHAYARHYKDDFTQFGIQSLERKVDIDFRGLRLRGMIDLTLRVNSEDDSVWLMDHKTTSKLDLQTVEGWDFRFQFMFYVWLALQCDPDLPIKGYFINAIKKPSIKVRQNDTLQMFFSRLEGEMNAEPEKYYYRDRLVLTKDALKHFEDTVLFPKLSRLNLLTQEEVPAILKSSIVENMNTDYCQRYGGACQFLPLCRRGEKLEGFQYTTRKAKHEELEEE